MTRRMMICVVWLVTCLTACAVAVTGATTTAAPAAVASGKKAAARPGATTAAKKPATPAAARPSAAARRLEDIHIEGEIPAPQVLFVTARDQRRFTRLHHGRYLKSSLQVGEETPLPARIAVTGHPSTHPATR